MPPPEGGARRWLCERRGTLACASWAGARRRWLLVHGVGEAYHGATLGEVAEAGGVRRVVTGYIERLGEHVRAGRGLLLVGGWGVGKTSILALVAAAAWEAGLPCELVHGDRLATLLRSWAEPHRALVERLKRVALLLIDDLPNEPGLLDELGEYRHGHGLATCVSTNMAVEGEGAVLRQPEWRRLADRWRERCWWVRIGGESRRAGVEGEP